MTDHSLSDVTGLPELHENRRWSVAKHVETWSEGSYYHGYELQLQERRKTWLGREKWIEVRSAQIMDPDPDGSERTVVAGTLTSENILWAANEIMERLDQNAKRDFNESWFLGAYPPRSVKW